MEMNTAWIFANLPIRILLDFSGLNMYNYVYIYITYEVPAT